MLDLQYDFYNLGLEETIFTWFETITAKPIFLVIYQKKLIQPFHTYMMYFLVC